MGNFLRVVLVVVLFVFLGLTNDSIQEHHHHNHREHHPETNSGDHVCASLRSGFTTTPSATVQVVGVLAGQLILLGNSKEVYSIPLKRINQLGIDLSGIRPEPLTTKWSHFVDAPNFDLILDPAKRIGLFTMQFQDGRQVIIAANYSDRTVGFVTVTAEVSPQEKVSTVYYNVPDSIDGINWVYFSSKEQNIFYSASRDPDLGGEFFREYTAGPGNAKYAASFTITARRLLCSQNVDNNTKVRFLNVSTNHETCKSFLRNWTAHEIQIFTDSVNFYLFNNKKVYVIPCEAYQNPGKEVTLGELEYSNFLRCPHRSQGSSHEPEPWPNQGSKSSHRSTNRGLTIFIYAGIGAGAILIIAIVSACFCACSKPNPAQPGAGEGQSAKFTEENLKSKSNDGKEAPEAEGGAGESNAAGGSENSKGDPESSVAQSSNAKSSSAAGGGKSAASNAGGGSSSSANGGGKSSSSSAKPPKKPGLKGKMKKMKSIRGSSASRSEAESSSQRSAKPNSKKTKKGKKMPTEKSSKSKQATKKKKKQNK